MHYAYGRLAMPHNLYPKALSLARPVALGHLTLTVAQAGLMADAYQAEREGHLDGCEAEDVFQISCHILRQRLAAERQRRELTEYRICRLLQPMIALHKPWGSLMAEAHGLNSAEGFPLTEQEVSDLVEVEVYWSLPWAPAARGGRRHAR